MHSRSISILLAACLLFAGTAFSQWEKRESGTLAWLKSGYFVSEKAGWLVGSNGTILATADGGKTWKREKKPTKDDIRDVFFVDEQQGWLLCERSVFERGEQPLSYLLRTRDGGVNWEPLKFGAGNERAIRLIRGSDARGHAIGEGGLYWRTNPYNFDEWGTSSLPVKFLMLDGAVVDDRTVILVGGGGTILFTTDGAKTWSQAAVAANDKAKLTAVHFAGKENGWIVGARGKIYSTVDGGKSWALRASPVTDDLSDVLFVDSNEAYIVGENGVALSTVTAGKVWTVERTNTTQRLERIIHAGDSVFAIGFGGLILHRQRSSAGGQR